jgi:hypothetical protein
MSASIGLKPQQLILIVTLVTSLTLHFSIFNRDLIGIHAWRQMQNQWNIRNFYRYENNILNPRIPAHNLGHEGNILRYEFPLMQWTIAQVERVFGESILVTRMIMFLTGCLGLFGFYLLAKEIFEDEALAACGAWIMSLAPIFYYYTLNPMSDVWAMTGQIWMMFYAVRFFYSGKLTHLMICSVWLSLSGLCKLPYLMFGIIPLASIALRYGSDESNLRATAKPLLILALSVLAPATWYIYVIRSWQSMGVLSGIFGKQDIAELKSYFINAIDHWLPDELMNPALFLVFILGAIFGVLQWSKKSKVLWMISSGGIMVMIYYLYEVNMIARIHDYYMLPFLVFIHLIILSGLSLLWKHRFTKYVSILILSILPGMVYPYVNNEYWNINRNGYNVDWFYHSKDLTQAVPRDSLCIILNDNTGTVKPYTVDKQGFVLDRDELPTIWMEDMILNRRATYMYSDSRKVDSSVEILPYLNHMILQKGSVKVFKLIPPDKLRAKTSK